MISEVSAVWCLVLFWLISLVLLLWVGFGVCVGSGLGECIYCVLLVWCVCCFYIAVVRFWGLLFWMFSDLMVCGFIDLIGLIVAGELVDVVKFWIGLLVYVNFFWFDFALWFVVVLDLFILLILSWGVGGLNCGFCFTILFVLRFVGLWLIRFAPLIWVYWLRPLVWFGVIWLLFGRLLCFSVY